MYELAVGGWVEYWRMCCRIYWREAETGPSEGIV